jgi:hypothetical protein
MYTFDVAWVTILAASHRAATASTLIPVTSARLVAQNTWKVNETGLRHKKQRLRGVEIG